jgi:DNA replication and repair protein RecF
LYFKRLSLLNFRNYAELYYEPAPHINCIVGKNGIGKTNILEAIHYLAMTKGFGAEKNALRYEASFFIIDGALDEDGMLTVVQCNYALNKGKKIFVDQKPVAKMSSHIGKIPIVTVLPEDSDLLKEGSALRRKWLDTIISQFDPLYLQTLIEYEKALAQRNCLLQQYVKEKKIDRDVLNSLNLLLTRTGIYIAEKRESFLEEFSTPFSFFYRAIVSKAETPEILRQNLLKKNTEQQWQEAFAQRYAKELVLGRTLVGIHRDDINFEVDNKPLRYFGSQGQIKTFVTALKFAQYHFLQNKTGKFPILLLDDIFDKLDEERIIRITELLPSYLKGQVFITDTSPARLTSLLAAFASSHFVTIENNQIQPIDA